MEVSTPQAALDALQLPADTAVDRLAAAERRRFAALIGWQEGGPVVSMPTPQETASREARERWKGRLAGNGRRDRCLFLTDAHLDHVRRRRDGDRDLRVWYRALLREAERVAALPHALWHALIAEQGPWNVAGSFCPACYGMHSDRSIHWPRWGWSVLDPEVIICPDCDARFPDPAYPEDAEIVLPRLGLTYPFYLSPEERHGDWRNGEHASRFGGAPTHVSLTGELRRARISWVLGQVEPLAIAAALTGDDRFAHVAGTILHRLADVYPRYPLYCYMQEYVDADPGWACESVAALPTAFRRGACWFSYDGTIAGSKVSWRESAGTSTSPLTRGEWGASRLAREKSGNGQLFLTLLRAYELIHNTLDDEACRHIERSLLLEMYLDVKALSRRIDNKAGPGATARVSVGVFYGLEEEIERGLEQFEAVLEGQFAPDGSWKETPLYGHKPLMEEMWMVPELLRGRRDLYQGLYRRALSTYAHTATPVGTGPALDDSNVQFQLPVLLREVAAARVNVTVPSPPPELKAFGLPGDQPRTDGQGYVPALTNIAIGDRGRLPMDGPLGFPALGHGLRRSWRRSLFGLVTPEAAGRARRGGRAALNRCYADRGLGCIGFGRGRGATQLYCNGGDGRTGHRHGDPLGLLLFAGGREVLPDIGYLADHPGAEWARHTAAHNTVVPDSSMVAALGPATLAIGRVQGPGRRLAGRWLRAEVRVAPRRWPHVGFADRSYRLRRLVILLRRPDGLPVLVDRFDVEEDGGMSTTWDYVVRAGVAGTALQGTPEGIPCEPLFGGATATPPWDFRSSGAIESPLGVRWEGTQPVAAWFGAGAELFTFASPAWRSAPEVFARPSHAWRAVALRTHGPRGRFTAAYDVIGPGGAFVEGMEVDGDGILLHADGGGVTVRADGGSAPVVT